MMKKSNKEVSKKSSTKGTSVAKKSSGSLRPSRLQKFAKKIESLGLAKMTTKQIAGLEASVIVTSVQPTLVFGFILSSDGSGVTIRQQKKSGSSKPAIRHYLRSEIISEQGSSNKPGMLTILAKSEVLNIRRANVTFDGSIVEVYDTSNGDTLRINRGIPGVEVEIIVIED
jgi:hypothetical protein